MIIAVSIVDRHRPEGSRHVGTYFFEIDYPAAEHDGQMSFLVKACPAEREDEARPCVGKLLTVAERREAFPLDSSSRLTTTGVRDESA